MPSTYTTNLGIQKPANGEQSGTWGQTVNANSDILDRAVNGSLSLSLSGTSSTLTTLQGSVSDGQYKVLELTGSPSGTHTITIDPATAQTLYLVNNTTAQSVIFTQGSGGNVTIVAGASAIIYSSGAGATAKVTNITNVFAMSNVKITGGTITGITDLAVADGGTGASTLTGYVKGTGTAALTASATIPSTDITGLGTMAAQSASSVAITGGSITGITDLAVADGGTGQGSALTQYGVIYGSTTTAMASTAAGTTTQVLHGNAAGAPTFGAVSLTADVSGTLPVGNGGTGTTTSTGTGSVVLSASPALTGTPTAPTATVGTNTTQIATTAFVLANGTAITTANVLAATAGATAGAVGTYVFAYRNVNAQVVAGTTYAGSGLFYAGFYNDVQAYPTIGANISSGTWRAMGTAGNVNYPPLTLFLRIS